MLQAARFRNPVPQLFVPQSPAYDLDAEELRFLRGIERIAAIALLLFAPTRVGSEVWVVFERASEAAACSALLATC